jgi:thiamine biosynthesis protein ThiI
MSEPTTIAPPSVLLVRYGELALKGGNRGEFERTLMRNMRAACASFADVRVERERGRMFVFAPSRLESVARRLGQVFGITSVSPAWEAANDIESISSVARAVLDDALAALAPGARPKFRVLTKRVDKRFPLTSMQLDLQVAERILRESDPIVVDLNRPELVLGIEVRSDKSYVFARRLRGPGGLPVGSLGRVLCLISGGIDSPVAAWMAMKRGAEVLYVTFHSHPFIGDSAKDKVIELVRVLSAWQPRSRLYVAPFADVQVAVKGVGTNGTEDSYRTVLYRRMMQRIASRIASSENAQALVTGESMGQVASQTLENLTCIGAAAELPVLRPLIAFDKQETIDIAQRIGTFALSAVQEPDCCTLFMPRKAVTRGRIEVCEDLEARFDVEGLVASSVARAERIDLD